MAPCITGRESKTASNNLKSAATSTSSTGASRFRVVTHVAAIKNSATPVISDPDTRRAQVFNPTPMATSEKPQTDPSISTSARFDLEKEFFIAGLDLFGFKIGHIFLKINPY
jgi:hypothetical protein